MELKKHLKNQLTMEIVKAHLMAAFNTIFFSGILTLAQVPEDPMVLESVGEGKALQRRIIPDNPQKEDQNSEKTNLPEGTHLRRPPITNKIVPTKEAGNLPPFAKRAEPLRQYQSGIVLPQNKSAGEPLQGLHIGDILRCRISQTFKAYENS